ncbi:uncharacterized protein [Cherax quadricarinatus]|uniref:uncharacterized protein n=1 Tax=Cherax quadricarinatus TaxID=27406 RepID=UPI00387E7EDF
MRRNLRGNNTKASKKTPKNQLFNKCSQEDAGPATTPLTTTQGDTTTITTNMAATSPSSPLFPGFNLPSSLSGECSAAHEMRQSATSLVSAGPISDELFTNAPINDELADDASDLRILVNSRFTRTTYNSVFIGR